MQAPSASDPSFKAFLEKLQEQNNRGFVTQVQLKAEREIAGEDNDKREEQLNDVISSLKEIRLAVTGVKIDIDLTPLVNIGENQTKLLEELNKEISLTRKLTEGSVEYDKEAAQYRNTSGRDIESKVSGKTSKDGGFLDFETARDTLSGQGKRAKEANAFDLKPINYTPGKAVAAAVSSKGSPSGGGEKENDKEEKSTYKGFFEEIKSGFKFFMTDGLSEKPGKGIFQTPSKEVEKKEEKDREAKVASPRQENPEADNVASTGEIQADASKSDLELSKQMLDTTKAQLVELKAIREALAPKTPKDLVEQKSGPTTEKEKESGGGGGGSILGDLASGAIDLLGGGGKKAPGKIAGKAAGIGGKILGGVKALGSKAVGFANSGAGKLLGSVAAVGLGAYTAYEGFTAAEDSKQAKMEEVQAKVDSGEMKPEEAAAARKEIGNTATVEKSGAVGEGTGMAAGAIAGAKLGATVGTFFGGPVGTAVGGLAGGALGAFAGSGAGKVVGEYGGKAINAAGEGIDYVKEKAGKLGSSVSGFFGGIGDKVKGAYGDAKETLEQTKNTVGDAAYTVGATAGANIERYTGVGKSIDKAIYNTKGFLGINTEPKVEDLGNGARKTVNPDGSFTISDAGGAKEYDTKGELSKKTSPVFMGSSTETNVKTGDVTSKYNTGPMELAQTKFAAGGSRSTGSYDLGTAIVKTRKTLTAKQQAEADLASGITPKETVDGKPAAAAKGATTDSAAFDKEFEAANADQDATEKYARSLDEIAMAEAKKGGRATPDQSDRRAAQIIARREALKTAGPGVTESTLKGVEVTPGGVLKGGKISNTGRDVNITSTENVDMGREAGKGGANNTVVSNNVSSNNTTKIVPMKANPRPEYTGSSLDRYTNRITVY